MYVAAVVLALVFAVAATAKWRDGHRIQPTLELGLAAALLLAPAWAGLLAIAVLIGFTTYLVRAMRRRQPCNCFGSASTEPVSATQLVRNAVLAGLAVLAAFAGAPSIVAIVVAAGAVAVAVVVLDRQHEGPRVGSAAPGIDGVRWPALVAFVSAECARCDPPPIAVRVDDRRARRAYRVRAVPYYVEVDAAGIVVWRGAELSARHSAT